MLLPPPPLVLLFPPPPPAHLEAQRIYYLEAPVERPAVGPGLVGHPVALPRPVADPGLAGRHGPRHAARLGLGGLPSLTPTHETRARERKHVNANT